MEDFKMHKVIMFNKQGFVEQLYIYATTEWHALDKAFYEHPEGVIFTCNKKQRTREFSEAVSKISDKW